MRVTRNPPWVGLVLVIVPEIATSPVAPANAPVPPVMTNSIEIVAVP